MMNIDDCISEDDGLQGDDLQEDPNLLNEKGLTRDQYFARLSEVFSRDQRRHGRIFSTGVAGIVCTFAFLHYAYLPTPVPQEYKEYMRLKNTPNLTEEDQRLRDELYAISAVQDRIDRKNTAVQSAVAATAVCMAGIFYGFRRSHVRLKEERRDLGSWGFTYSRIAPDVPARVDEEVEQ